MSPSLKRLLATGAATAVLLGGVCVAYLMGGVGMNANAGSALKTARAHRGNVHELKPFPDDELKPFPEERLPSSRFSTDELKPFPDDDGDALKPWPGDDSVSKSHRPRR